MRRIPHIPLTLALATAVSIVVLAVSPLPAAASWAGSITVYFGSGDGAGAVTSDDGGIDCHYADLRNSGDCSQSYVFPDFLQSALVTITYTPEQNSYVCVDSSGGCVTSGAAQTVTLEFKPEYTNEVFLTPSFRLMEYRIQVNYVGPGTVSTGGTTCTPTTSFWDICRLFKYGESVTLTAIPASGSKFGGWAVGPCNDVKSTVCQFTMSGHSTTNALFDSWKITHSTTAGGRLCLQFLTADASCIAPGTGPFGTILPDGTQVHATANALAGWHFVRWNTDGPCAGSGPSCSFALRSAVTLKSSFAEGPAASPKPTPTPTPKPTPRPTPSASLRPTPTPLPTRFEPDTSAPAPSRPSTSDAPSSTTPAPETAPPSEMASGSIDPTVEPATSQSAAPITGTGSGSSGTPGPTVPDGSAGTSGFDMPVLLAAGLILLLMMFVLAFLAGRRRTASGNASRIA